jgi:uncharacterized membrane protein required for colicin V production
MTLLDWALVVLWLGVTLSGFWEGAVRLVFGGGGLIAGIWLAVVAGPEASAVLSETIGVEWLAGVLARLVLVLACVGLCLLAGWGIERTLKALHLGWLNRLAGAALAGGLAIVLLALFLTTASRLSPTWSEWCERSVIAPRLALALDLAAEARETEVQETEADTAPAGEEGASSRR